MNLRSPAVFAALYLAAFGVTAAVAGLDGGLFLLVVAGGVFVTVP